MDDDVRHLGVPLSIKTNAAVIMAASQARVYRKRTISHDSAYVRAPARSHNFER
jgi:hypothetical protein